MAAAHAGSMTHKREMIALALAAAGTAGCQDDPFPAGFVFGTAVAGFQIEMGCPTIPAEECEDRRSDWYEFITSTVAISRQSNHLAGDPPSSGPGYYELYAQDLERVAGLGLQSFRFSVEWSRLFPESTRGATTHEELLALASPTALAYYRAQLAELEARGVAPLVTLNHYTLPVWIHDAVGCNTRLDTCSPRGWLEPDIVAEISKYAGFVARELGDGVDVWATENEPLAVVVPGYLLPTPTRTNPPAVSLRTEAKQVIVRMIEAHARMYDAIKANDLVDADGDGSSSSVGVVYAVAPVHPKNPDDNQDKRAARNVFYLYNEVFLNGVILGVLDDDLDGTGELVPELTGRSDYLGVNYYTRVVVEGELESVLPQFSPLLTLDPLTLQQGEVYPKGIYESLIAMRDLYPGVPLNITENGNDARAGDSTEFLVEHLGWVERAITEGADVRGYHWWSLMDNYEWNHGMSYQFGLYAVDPEDPAKARTQRPVAEALSRIARGREIPGDLRGKYPLSP